jgi:hypothetical protein
MHSTHFAVSRCAVMLGMLLALTACGNGATPASREVPGASDVASQQPAVATAAASKDPVADAPATDDGVHDASFEVQQARRLSQAQAYLDRARDAALTRHDLAVGQCQQSAPNDSDTCIATADESLQAELRAARVEFDALMAQPDHE